MNSFIDISVLPDPEFTESYIMNQVFLKLHHALVKIQNTAIGISFPKADKTLGNCMRLHGSSENLNMLMAEKWLSNLVDYTDQTAIQQVPQEAQHCTVKRVQAKSSAERLRRRSVTKGWLSEEGAVERITKDSEKRLNLPYINLKSSSTKQNFRLFIQQKAQSEAVAGCFNTYGLSSKATVPWF